MKDVQTGIVELKLDCEDKKIEFPIALSRMAIWERYVPYLSKTGYYEAVEKIFERKPDSYVNDEGLLSNKIRMESLYQNLSNLLTLRSSQQSKIFKVVECGTGAFVSTRIIVHLLSASNIREVSLDAYDTFSGLPASDVKEDPQRKGLYSHSLLEFERIFNDYKFIKAHKGKIPNTLNANDSDMYDFVHIDLDLYEGTFSSLCHFYPRLNRLGIIQLDDYNNTPWKGVNKAVDQFLETLSPDQYFLNCITLGGAFIVKL